MEDITESGNATCGVEMINSDPLSRSLLPFCRLARLRCRPLALEDLVVRIAVRGKYFLVIVSGFEELTVASIRHLKCDGEKPCAQCIKKNIDCNRNLRVRFRNKSKTGRQPLPHNGSTSPPVPRESTSSAGSAGLQQPHRDYASPGRGSSPRVSPGPGFLEVQHAPHVEERQYQAFSHSPESASAFPLCQTLSNTEFPLAPLNDCVKATLFRHYIANIAPAFDSYDPNQYLTARVPSLAAPCPPFLELILIVAARHLDAVQGDGARVNTGGYGQQLPPLDAFLEQLVQSGMNMEHLDVAILLYYFSQNMQGEIWGLLSTLTVKFCPPSTPLSIAGPSDLIPQLDLSKLQVSPLLTQIPVTFHDAVLWSCLRQELFLAVMNQLPINLDMYLSSLQDLTQTGDDFARTNKMLLLLLEVVRFCFGDGKDTGTYDGLLESTSSWMASIPASFTPVMIRRQKCGPCFPEIWLLNECVAAGLQYYHLSRILLIVHDPRVPRLCRARREANRWIDAQVKNDLEIICGIAESINQINPMHITACMAISMVGDRCSRKSQQTAVIEILDKTAREYGWATDLARRHLLDGWGWPLSMEEG
ncbi:hypothetical protein ACJZ2D_016314 [Fusarium nematophilum]